MLSVGIIGCGGVVERRHLPGLLELPDVARITAMADVDEGRLAALAELAGVAPGHRYGNVKELLAKETLDLLIVATPLVYHEEAVLEAAGRVPAVLVEKPLSHDVASGERMVEACERAGTRLGVVHNELVRPSVEAAARLVVCSQIGTPRPSTFVWARRARSAMSSMVSESMPANHTPRREGMLQASAVRQRFGST